MRHLSFFSLHTQVISSRSIITISWNPYSLSTSHRSPHSSLKMLLTLSCLSTPSLRQARHLVAGLTPLFSRDGSLCILISTDISDNHINGIVRKRYENQASILVQLPPNLKQTRLRRSLSLVGHQFWWARSKRGVLLLWWWSGFFYGKLCGASLWEYDEPGPYCRPCIVVASREL